MLLGPIIGRQADRFGRRLIIPTGIWMAAVSALILAPPVPVWLAVLVITTLSAGYDMTQPLLASIASALDPPRRGQAIGLNAFTLFVGFGLGSVVFQYSMKTSLATAIVAFAAAQALLGVCALRFFRDEVARHTGT